ncbi:MAG: SUMF1/EgtB/PvdO family nonheme iron enzyme [Acidobacteria bacterium]|nr:SUMF1/EgtB/PvdO family nonheme iron enzyme [Acidobacteriota bacterium]
MNSESDNTISRAKRGRKNFPQPSARSICISATLVVAGKPAGRLVIESRVLRGGSWNNNQDNARADYRNHNHPDNRNNNIGFRVVCSSHIHHRPPNYRQVPQVTACGMRRRAVDGAGPSSPHVPCGVRAHTKHRSAAWASRPVALPRFTRLHPRQPGESIRRADVRSPPPCG